MDKLDVIGKDMSRSTSTLKCRKTGSVNLECEIDLARLFETRGERDRFDKKWADFLRSDPNNKEIFKLEKDRLIYTSEQLVPEKVDNRPPLLLVLGNPACHSITAGMFL